MLFEHGNTILLGAAGIHGRFEHYIIAFLQHLSYRARSSQQRLQVGKIMLIDRRRHCNYKEARFFQLIERCGKRDISSLEIGFGKLVAGIDAVLHHLHPLLVDIETYYGYLFCECQRDGKTYIS
jgi:hypothetical protein